MRGFVLKTSRLQGLGFESITCPFWVDAEAQFDVEVWRMLLVVGAGWGGRSATFVSALVGMWLEGNEKG